MATIVVPVLEITIAVLPPMEKADGFSRLLPVMVTKVPIVPLAGLKDVMKGMAGMAGSLANAIDVNSTKASTAALLSV